MNETDNKTVQLNQQMTLLGVLVTDLLLLFVLFIAVIPGFDGVFNLEELTGGWLQLTLILSWLRLVAAMAIILIAGKMKPRDLGLNFKDLPFAMLVTATIWTLMNGILFFVSLVRPEGIATHPGWLDGALPATAGGFIAQFLGNAFAEEVIYRGFVLMAVMCAFPAKDEQGNKILAALISSIFFTLPHLPVNLYNGYNLFSIIINMGIVFLLGLLFAGIYLRTGNLFIAVGIHTLINAPLPLFAAPDWLIGNLPVLLGLGVILFGKATEAPAVNAPELR